MEAEAAKLIGAGLASIALVGAGVGMTIPGSPAEQAGLQAGDRILEIDGKSTDDITNLDQAVGKLKGEPGVDHPLLLRRRLPVVAPAAVHDGAVFVPLLHGDIVGALDHNLLLPFTVALVGVMLALWMLPLVGRPARRIAVPPWAAVTAGVVIAVFTVLRNLPMPALAFLGSG